jgi:transcriptional regulator with XRE-family HTH domain
MNPEELIEWRKRRGLNQVDLADKLNVTKACISRWESGHRKIPAFLHLALECLKVKKDSEHKTKERKGKVR